MSPNHPSLPPMTQVSVGDTNCSFREPLPSKNQTGTLQRLPRAHLHRQSPAHSRALSNEPHQYLGPHGSVSSDGTGSSSPSIHKAYSSRHSAHQYQLSSNAETGSIGSRVASKQGYARTHTDSQQEMSVRQPSVFEDGVAIHRYIREEDHGDENDHAIWILVWLSFLDPLFSLFSALFSIIVVLSLLLISPIRFCQPSCSIGTSTIRTIAPVFRNRLRLIYASSVEEAHTFDFKPVMLVLVHVISPFLSMGVAVAAWISAAFWLFALTMGNPDGTERRDDGRAAVLAVRDWWEKLLLNAVR